jgi:DNA-damage-inducible protein J
MKGGFFMAVVNTSIKIDQTLKQESQELFESFGLSLSSAINMFLRQAVREQAIPFRIGNPLPNSETIKAIEDARKGIGLSRGFTSVSELMEDLDADD